MCIKWWHYLLRFTLNCTDLRTYVQNEVPYVMLLIDRLLLFYGTSYITILVIGTNNYFSPFVLLTLCYFCWQIKLSKSRWLTLGRNWWPIKFQNGKGTIYIFSLNCDPIYISIELWVIWMPSSSSSISGLPFLFFEKK